MTLLLDDLAWPRRTERLELRLAKAADAPEVWSWYRRPEVGRWLTTRTADQEEFRSWWIGHLPTSLVATAGGRIVATAKVAVQDAWAQADVKELARGQEAELGWVVDPDVQGAGLGTELGQELLAVAFDLGVRRVVAMCFADNLPSWRVMERIGMRREGVYVRESLHRSGQWLDGMSYALLADEWTR